jgi:hypothetical protein
MDILILSAPAVNPTPTDRSSPEKGNVGLPATLRVGPPLTQLIQGQVVTAIVQRVVDLENTVWLELAGRTTGSFVARTKVPLQAQQHVSLEVVQANSARITLRVLHPSDFRALGSELPGNSHSLTSVLAGWGIQPDAVNLAIAEALLVHGQSILPEDVESVRLDWQRLPERQPADIQALAYLHANQLPVEQEALDLAHRWLAGQGSPLRLAGLHSALGEALAQVDLLPAVHNTPALERLQQELAATLAQMVGGSIPAELPTPEIAARLAALVTVLGTPPEAELAAHLLETAQATGAAPGQAAGAATGGSASPSRLRPEGGPPPVPHGVSATGQGAQDAIAQTLTNPPGRAAHSVGAWGEQMARLMSALADVLAEEFPQVPAGPASDPHSAGLDQPTAHVLRRLQDQLHLVSSDLGALHLANLAEPRDSAAERSFCFPIPLATGGEQQTAYLKVYRRPGERSLDPRNLRLALLLDLPELGEIAVNLHLSQCMKSQFERHLSGQILSGRQQTQRLVESDLAWLLSRLNALGYQIDSLSSGLLKEVAAEPIAPGAQGGRSPGHPPGAPLLTQIDVSI